MMFDLNNIRDFLAGANRFYQQFDRREIHQKIAWQEGSTRLINYSQTDNIASPILFFIPSLINKSYILDLDSQNSMVKFFAQNYQVYLFDFNEPLNEEIDFTLIDYTNRLNRAIEYIAKEKPIITIGYCLGGVFSLNIKANIVSRALIATPWDLSHLSEHFGLNNPLIASNAGCLFSSNDKISPLLIQAWFSSLNFGSILNKFSQFSQMQDEKDIDKFIAIEQWVNDGISLTKGFALQCLDILQKNNLAELIELNPNIPTLAIHGLQDKIVPPSSCLPLYNILPNCQIFSYNTGHIGLIVSSLAKTKVWNKIIDFIVAQP